MSRPFFQESLRVAPSKELGSIGGRIAQGRRELGVRLQRDITPADLAKMLDVNPATVYRWESGEKAPRDDALTTLAKLFGVTPAYLRYGVGQGGELQGFPQPDPTKDRLITEDEIERARQSVVRKSAKKSGAHRKRRGA